MLPSPLVFDRFLFIRWDPRELFLQFPGFYSLFDTGKSGVEVFLSDLLLGSRGFQTVVVTWKLFVHEFSL